MAAGNVIQLAALRATEAQQGFGFRFSWARLVWGLLHTFLETQSHSSAKAYRHGELHKANLPQSNIGICNHPVLLIAHPRISRAPLFSPSVSRLPPEVANIPLLVTLVATESLACCLRFSDLGFRV